MRLLLEGTLRLDCQFGRHGCDCGQWLSKSGCRLQQIVDFCIDFAPAKDECGLGKSSER